MADNRNNGPNNRRKTNRTTSDSSGRNIRQFDNGGMIRRSSGNSTQPTRPIVDMSADASRRRSAGTRGTGATGSSTGTRRSASGKSKQQQAKPVSKRRAAVQQTKQKTVKQKNVKQKATKQKPIKQSRTTQRKQAQKPVKQQRQRVSRTNKRQQQKRIRQRRHINPFSFLVGCILLPIALVIDGTRSIVGMFRYNKDAAGSMRQTQDKKRSANNWAVFAIVPVIFVLIAAYVAGYIIKRNNVQHISYQTVELGTVDSEKSATGIIIRSEKVFTAPSSGSVMYEVSENDKVKSGTVVCSISDTATNAQTEEKAKALSEDILKQQESREDISDRTDEVKRLESQIKTLTDDNVFSYATGDISSVYNLKYSAEKKLDTRNQLLLTENSSSLSDLVSQLNTENKRLDDNTNLITSDVGGIVSYSVDGMEATLTPDVITSLTQEQVKQKPDRVGNISATAVANDPLFKIVTSNDWYIAAYIPDSYTEGWAEDDTKVLYLQNGVEGSRPVETTLTVLQHGEKEAYVVFKTDDYMLDYIDFRNISFELDKPKTGYKIPTTAICQQTLVSIPEGYISDNKTVNKVTDDGISTITVAISGTNTTDTGVYSLVMMETGYLIPGDTLQSLDGQQTIKLDSLTDDGVFLVNSGVAEFVKISLDDSVTNGNYTVLDQNNNPDLHVYDRVVENAADVNNNENIYSSNTIFE